MVYPRFVRGNMSSVVKVKINSIYGINCGRRSERIPLCITWKGIPERVDFNFTAVPVIITETNYGFKLTFSFLF